MKKLCVFLFVFFHFTTCVICQSSYDTSMYYEVFPIENPLKTEETLFVKGYPLEQIITTLNESYDTVLLCTLKHSRQETMSFVAFKKGEWSGFRIIDESLSDYGGNVWDSTMHYWTVCITSPIHDSNDFSMDSLFDQLNSQIKKPLVFSKLSGSTHHYTYIYFHCGNTELYQEIQGGMKSLYSKVEPLHTMIIHFKNNMPSKESYVLKRKMASTLY